MAENEKILKIVDLSSCEHWTVENSAVIAHLLRIGGERANYQISPEAYNKVFAAFLEEVIAECGVGGGDNPFFVSLFIRRICGAIAEEGGRSASVEETLSFA